MTLATITCKIDVLAITFVRAWVQSQKRQEPHSDILVISVQLGRLIEMVLRVCALEPLRRVSERSHARMPTGVRALGRRMPRTHCDCHDECELCARDMRARA